MNCGTCGTHLGDSSWCTFCGSPATLDYLEYTYDEQEYLTRVLEGLD